MRRFFSVENRILAAGAISTFGSVFLMYWETSRVALVNKGETIAEVLESINDVRTRPSGRVFFIPAKQSTGLSEGDAIFTGPDSLARIKMADGENVFEVKSMSLVSIRRQDDGLSVDLGYGSIEATISNNVAMKVSGVDVSGSAEKNTKLVLEKGTDGNLAYAVKEGKLDVAVNGQAVSLVKGKVLNVPVSQKNAPLRTIARVEISSPREGTPIAETEDPVIIMGSASEGSVVDLSIRSEVGTQVLRGKIEDGRFEVPWVPEFDPAITGWRVKATARGANDEVQGQSLVLRLTRPKRPKPQLPSAPVPFEAPSFGADPLASQQAPTELTLPPQVQGKPSPGPTDATDIDALIASTQASLMTEPEKPKADGETPQDEKKDDDSLPAPLPDPVPEVVQPEAVAPSAPVEAPQPDPALAQKAEAPVEKPVEPKPKPKPKQKPKPKPQPKPQPKPAPPPPPPTKPSPPPPDPSQIGGFTPPNGSRVIGFESEAYLVTLSWQPKISYDEYQVEMRPAGNANPIVREVTTFETVDVELMPGAYEWRVRGRTGGRTQIWSQWQRLKVESSR
jgi:hypothetical protein